MAGKINIPYVDYNSMREFYTIKETCELLNVDKYFLKDSCGECEIEPIESEIGDYGFSKYCVRKVHNYLYRKFYDKDKNAKKADPWA